MVKKKINSIIEKLDNAIFLFYKNIILYSSCRDISFTMKSYIYGIALNEYKYLRKYPVYVPNRYYNAIKELITTEYTELSDGSEMKALEIKKDRLKLLRLQQKMIYAAKVILITDKNNKDVLEFLDKSGLSVNGLNGEMKMIETEISEIENSFKTDKDIEENNEKTTNIEIFYSMFAVLSKNGYLSGINMTVIDYIEKLNLYRREVKEIEKIKLKK